eukprot:gb/GECG01014677.1/.p1 GENE.gb/GECG01014677.1/~~gb/GECG01014677.1/.p1  ORF type:complete len:105 (+),score=6.73 gb/GECG01014677.1/:1-315(+)
MIPGCLGRPTMLGNTARGASSPANPAWKAELRESEVDAERFVGLWSGQNDKKDAVQSQGLRKGARKPRDCTPQSPQNKPVVYWLYNNIEQLTLHIPDPLSITRA